MANMKSCALLCLLVFTMLLGYSRPACAQEVNGRTGVNDVSLLDTPGQMLKKQYSEDTTGFTKLESGLRYKVIKHGTGTRHPQLGDHIEMNIHLHIRDSVLFDSRRMNNNKPVPYQVVAPTYKGDPIEGFMQLVAGDSALIRMPVDSILKQGKQVMPGLKEGDVQAYDMVLVSVMSGEDYRKDQAEKSARQKIIDDSLLVAYFKANNIHAEKTASGLYYTFSKRGKGENIRNGQYASVNYTGRLLGDKNVFDSNTDPEFRHVEPYTVCVGTGGVIKGWDEALLLFKNKTKGTIYIPSHLAYSNQDRSPTIPPNSILVFDMEIVKVKSQADVDEQQIEKYIAEKKIPAKRTSSGLYYTITRETEGRRPLRGEKVLVRYNGTFMDGKRFDGNLDSKDPFTFTLGEHEVIAGWDEGIGLLRKGSKATFIIPSELAYGSHASGVVPANAILLFDVELVDIQKHD